MNTVAKPGKVSVPSGAIPSATLDSANSKAPSNPAGAGKAMPKGFGGGLIPGKIKG